jgi:N-acetylmuramoyl-L-alanine amidase
VKHLSSSFLVTACLLLLPSPAQASRLESWRFDNNQNRLEFATDEDVQPRAQMVVDPTRLVIDLPGIALGRPSFTQSVSSGAVRSVRFGQFDRGTTRIVVELAPGYTLDANQVKFRGISPRQWMVQLPAPQRAPASRAEPVAYRPLPTAEVHVVPVVTPITAGGRFGQQPQSIERPALSNSPSNSLPSQTAQAAIATIDSVQLENGDRNLVIRANQTLRYESGWDRATASYRITIRSAQLATRIQGPQLNANSPILKVRLRQEDARTVVILIQPAAGVQISDLNQPTLQTLSLQLQRQTVPAVISGRSPVASVPVPPPARPSYSTPTLPRVPNGKIVVVIDPGHGGPDPGAVGIGGLQEKGIVLDIGIKVADLLEKQGIQAVLTRKEDIDLDLEPRVQMAQQLNATLFVSIHANSIDLSRPDISGLETYYYQKGAELAQTIHQSVLEGTGITDRRVRTARFYVLRKTSMPSVLVEVGFVTGRDDAARLSNPSYRSQMASAIVRGILQYIQKTTRSY